MAAVLGDHDKQTGSGVTSRASKSMTTVSGCAMFVHISDPNMDSSVGDNKGNTYTEIGSSSTTQRVFYCPNANGGSNHVVTVTWNTGSADPTVIFCEWRGLITTPLDTGSLVQIKTGTSPYTTTTGTLAETGELILFFAASQNSGDDYTTGGGFTVVEQENNSSLYWTACMSYLNAAPSTTAVSASLPNIPSDGTIISRTISGFRVASAGGTTVAPGAGAVAVTGQTPTMSRTQNATARPSAGAVALTGQTPTAVRTQSGVAQPGAGTVAVAGQTPTAVRTQNVLRQPGAGAVTVAGQAPSTGTGPRIGGHGLGIDFIGAGTPTTSTSSFTSENGSIVLAAVARGMLSEFPASIVYDNKGNGNYSQVGTAHPYSLWTGSGTALYSKLNANGGTGHIVTTDKPTNDDDEVSVIAAEFRGVNAIVDQQWSEDLTSPNTSASVTTTGPAILGAFWFGDDAGGALDAVPDGNWTQLDHTTSVASNHVQCASAYRVVSGAGTYSVTWVGDPPQGAQLWIIAMQLSGESTSAQPGTGAVTVAGSTPTAVRTQNVVAQPGVGAVTVTGQTPARMTGAVAQPGVGTIVVTGQTPARSTGFTAQPGAGAVTTAGQTPSAASSNSFIAQPGVGAITVTGLAPSLAGVVVSTPDAGLVSIQGYEPTVLNTTPAEDNLLSAKFLGRRKNVPFKPLRKEPEALPVQEVIDPPTPAEVKARGLDLSLLPEPVAPAPAPKKSAVAPAPKPAPRPVPVPAPVPAADPPPVEPPAAPTLPAPVVPDTVAELTKVIVAQNALLQAQVAELAAALAKITAAQAEVRQEQATKEVVFDAEQARRARNREKAAKIAKKLLGG